MLTEAHEAARNIKADLSTIVTFDDAVAVLKGRGVTSESHGMAVRDNMAEALLDRARAASRVIYEQHDAAFSQVSAYVVVDRRDGDKVATVAFKFGKSGLRVTAFVHWLGVPMVKGIANGGGYDRQTASAAHAVRKTQPRTGNPDPMKIEAQAAFYEALRLDGGKRWDDALRDLGFSVFQAV